MRKLLHAGVLALGLLAAGCGGAGEKEAAAPIAADQVNASPSPYASPDMSEGPMSGALIELGDTEIGKVLVGEEGRTLYLFKKDKDDTSSCSGDCAAAWPPYITDGEPEAGDGVKADLLGTTKREDGTSQVTYNRHPLYYYVKDENAGDVKGNDVEAFGGEWYAVTADGKKAKDKKDD
ncbi:hypothetical protein OHA77_19580 [Streptosporangium sp. NBC_01639]|uniref:COG4315 family predicted lipoprotein n=1 Tax=unclassified Streptosporangium TaxID=2632669 RepID=UPI002DD95DEC|nr:hypothetical protein [Streptosporangium sp. NBC_01756]WSC90455.1 hypothetical protein OIE48_20460 [Streptosporangium sp. NBC_01756]WTD58643.1 hypothetical protein OHA77_19580 [Streptosporangium sp. NBC_01639]